MKKTLTVMAMVIALAMSTMAMASADVERYQFTDVVLDITEVNGVEAYAHYYEFQFNPCSEEWEVLEAYEARGDETVTDISVDGNQVTYTSNYDFNDYSYTATIEVDGSLTLVSGTGGVNSVTGTGSITQTDYNHGEYVADSVDEYGPDAKSCIGMPMVSNRK